MKSVILKSLEEKEKTLVNKKNALYIEADSIDKELKKCTKLLEYIGDPTKFLDLTPREAVALFKTAGLDDEKEIKATYVRLIHQAMQVGSIHMDNDDEPVIPIGKEGKYVDTVIDDRKQLTYHMYPEEYDKYIRRLISPRRERQTEKQVRFKEEILKLLNKEISKSGVIYKINNIEVPIFMVKDRLDKMLRGTAELKDIIPIMAIAFTYDYNEPLTRQDVLDVERALATLTRKK